MQFFNSKLLNPALTDNTPLMATIAPSVPAAPAPAPVPSALSDSFYNLITNHLSSSEITSLIHRLVQSDYDQLPTLQSSASPKRYAAAPTTTMEYINQLNLNHDSSENPDLPEMARASVPRLDSGLRLDASGAFVVASREEADSLSIRRRSSASFKIEVSPPHSVTHILCKPPFVHTCVCTFVHTVRVG